MYYYPFPKNYIFSVVGTGDLLRDYAESDLEKSGNSMVVSLIYSKESPCAINLESTQAGSHLLRLS